MNAMTAIAAPPLDDIRCFLPGINDAEYELRAKLRSHRNVASALIGKTESADARTVAWIVVEWTTEAMFTPASHALLAEVAKLCGRLLISALHAERLELGVVQ